MHVPFVNLSKHTASLCPELRDAVERVLRSGQYILGDEVAAFEQEFAHYLGVQYAVGVNSGTDALTLAMRTAGWEEMRVVVPAMTFVATAAAVIHAGATPLFADVDPQTGMLSEATIDEAIRTEYAAGGWTFQDVSTALTGWFRLVPVHLYGAPQSKFSHERWLRGPMIEDAAEACGARWPDEDMVGTRGVMGCFSFVPTKNLGCCGDGGMVVTNRPEFDRDLRRWRDHGRVGHATHVLPGYNSRLDALQAAILRVKLPYLEGWNERRRQIVSFYQTSFSKYNPEIIFPEVEGTGGYQVCVILVPTTVRRSALWEHCRTAGIDVKMHYDTVVPDHEAYRPYIVKGQTFPHARRWAQRCLTLPNFPEMTDGEVEYVVDVVTKEVSGWTA